MSVDSEIASVKAKISRWLSEESCKPAERSDSRAHFAIEITFNNQSFAVIQPKERNDSLSVGSRMGLATFQVERLKKMELPKKEALIWELHLALMNKNQLSLFELGPHLPTDFNEATIQSRPIYYDALTKDRLMSAIESVFRAFVLIQDTIDKYSGSITPMYRHKGLDNP